MRILTENEKQTIKLKLQGFLYTERELIFNKAVLPEPTLNYTEEDLSILEPLTVTFKNLFQTSIGILTSSDVKLNDKKCIACQRCTKFCPSNALEKIGVDLALHEDKCIKCGNCIGNCPFLALKAPKTGLGIYIKNSISHKPHILTNLYRAQDVEGVLKHLQDFFNEYKLNNENLYETIERVGFEKLTHSFN